MKDKNIFSVLIKVVLGLACLGFTVYLLIGRWWYKDAWVLIKGATPMVLALIGVVLLAVAKD